MKKLLAAFGVTAAFALSMTGAMAQGYPERTITMIVPEVVKQDRSEHKKPELMQDKDLVPEDLSDTWTVQAHQGRNMRVVAGSLADEILCQKE